MGAADHHGLVGMRERARLLHGSFAATRSPWGGVRITVSIPLTQTEDSHGR